MVKKVDEGGEGVEKLVVEASGEAPSGEAGGELMEGLVMDEDLPNAVQEMMDAGYTSEQVKVALEKNYQNRKKAEMVEVGKATPAEAGEDIASQVATAKTELETVGSPRTEVFEETSGPKTLEELLKAMEGEGGSDYGDFDYAETGFARKEFFDLMESIKTIKAKAGNEVALQNALEDYRLTDNTTFDDKVRDKAIELFKKEYGVPETDGELAERKRKTKIEDEIKQAYQKGGFSHTRYTTHEDFGDYDEALERAERWLQENEKQVEEFSEKPPGAWAKMFYGKKAKEDYDSKLRGYEACKKRIPNIEIVIAAIQEIRESYEK